MSIFTRMLRRIGVKAAKNDYGGTWTALAGGPDAITERSLLEANKEWVFMAVDKVASAVAGVRYKVMRYKNSGDDVEVFDGPIVDFLEKPGHQFTGKDFIYLNTVYKELTGNAFWERITRREVAPLIPSNVSPVLSKDGDLVGFRVLQGTKIRHLTDSDVLHDRYIDPARPYWGKGKLQRITRWVDTSFFVTEFLNRFFANGATFGGFITTEEDSQDRIALIKAGLKNDHVGVENSHKIGVLPKGSDFKQTTSKMSDMEMGDTDDRYRDKILANFGVPKSMLGLVTDVNRANAEAMEYVFAKYTIAPIVKDLVEFLNETVVPTLDSTGRYYIAYEEFIPVNTEVLLREREIALGKQPYKTVNEVRAEVGLPPVKGGDIVYGNPLQVPLGQPSASPDPAADDDPDEEDEAPQKALPARARAGMKQERMLETIASKALAVISASIDPDAESHKSFVARVDAHEKIVAGKVRDFNNRQEREVIVNLKQITLAIKKGDLFDMDGEVAALIDFVSPVLKGLMLEQAIAEYQAQSFSGTFDTNEARITRTVELAAKRLARSYNSTTANLLKAALNEGITEGEDITQLAERVRQVYEFSNAYRALAVARTESFYIANEGSREAYRQSGVVQTMRWYTADSEACEYCSPMNGRTISVNDTFFPKGYVLTGSDGGTLTLDYRAIDVPPLHTNCRCFIRPEKIDIT